MEMALPGHSVLHFQYLKVELGKQNWRGFVDSENPVAAALLAKMRYNEKEKREVRFAGLNKLAKSKKKER